MQTINAEQAVKMVDSTAKFFVWSDGPMGWVSGNGWETKVCANSERAWFVAMEMIAEKVTA